jgi:hypothetical protein
MSAVSRHRSACVSRTKEGSFIAGQGSEFPLEPIRHEATQEQIEDVQRVLDAAAGAVRDLGWPVRMLVFPPGAMIVRDAPFPPTQNDEYVYGFLLPISGPVDLWRQHANRDKREA